MVSKIDKLVDLPDIQKTRKLTETEIRARIDKYIEQVSAVGIREPQANDLLGFFQLVQNAIRSREASDKVPEGKELLVLANDPPEEIDTEAITYYLNARAPGQMNRGGHGESRVKEVVPHLRSIQQHPEHIGEKLVTMGRFFDNYIAFNVYARDDFTALKRVLWLEKVMDSFRWYFRVHGINQVIEVGVGDKQQVKIGELLVTKYPMSYFIRTEDTFQFGSQELKQVELNTDVSLTN